MSTRKFRTLITDIGLAKLAATTAPGGKPVRLTHMAVGDGNGELRQPQKNQTSLYNEVWRQSVNRVFTDPENPNRLIAELVIPPETGGFWVREIGVFDDTGTMIAVGNTAESYKPTREEGSGRAQIFRAVITVTSDAVVELVMDTTTILPTTDYIDEKIAEHARSRNHPDATLTEKGFTQLSSATNSTSETLAATPKAVKAAYDLAAGKAPASHTHPWSQITGVPAASLTAKGTVQLSSATDSQSETEAATPKAVKIAYDLARGKYTAQDATTTRKGIVQLSSAINSTSETLAATPKAVKAAYDLAAGKAPASHTHPWSQITGVPAASLTAKGTVQLSSATNSTSETLAATPKAVKAAYDLAAGKAPASHTHPWSQITGVPAASLTAKGTVQLSSATDSQSETEAATPKAVKIAYDLARGKYTAQDATTTRKGIVQLSSAINSTSETLAATPKAVKAAYDLAAGKAPASHTHPWSQITGVPAASLTAKGTVQLSSATDSQSETEAATPKAVKIAYDLARGKYTAQDATTTRKGIVQLSSAINSTSETLAATPKAVKAAYDLAAGKAPASHTHPWSQITGVPAASLTAKGTVQLSSAINSTSEILAATPKAVKAAYDLANGKQPADATLTALAGLATAADRLPYFTGADRAALATLTAIGRAIIAKGSIKDVLNYLGLGEGSALPVGVPVPWPTATPPAGWLKCDGRAFTKEQYPVLARAYPTLRLPDLRGEFIRGWDDGRKVDTGRKLLSAQGATLLRTAMLDYYNQDTTGTSGIVGMGFNNEDSITDLREGSFKMPDGTTFSDPVVVMSDNGMQATILTSIRSGYAKGITVRPRSIALNYIVRAV
ncbi:tail fiber protein [Escherichia coli]|uniref:Tail fiber protein n=11 Tax=Escherichia coli TaxID=562 RepID=A0AAW6W4S9_ECOLX|nr:phage tail protein [Escherichia coli]MDK2697210.1 tail fiber protein [Escherichia coli]